ncbi:Ig-like domain-containing protein [Clostridium sp. E02]|nr:Ig-like domain-containing protein [Clostridium sp. E02]
MRYLIEYPLSVDDHLNENTNMTWTSSNDTIAQVDANGVVTGRGMSWIHP